MKPDYVIFPDASQKRSGKKCYDGYGVVVLDAHNQRYIVDSGELHDRTVPYCEAFAIYRGLQYVEYFRKSEQNVKVLIVSDSKINVKALNIWIPHVWDLSDYSNWQKRNGKGPVSNQDIYRRILKLIGNNHYKVKVVHIRSHSDIKPGVRSKIKHELKSNGVNVNEATLNTFIEMNSLADKAASDAADAARSDTFMQLKRKDAVNYD